MEQIMASFPLHGSLMLSPLRDDLICLTDKEMCFRESRAVPIRHKGPQESSQISVNGSDFGRSDGELVGEKKPKASEKKAFTAELKNFNVHNTQNGGDFILKKATDVDTSVCDEIVSNALRLPLLSNSYCSVADSAKDTARNADISRVVNKSAIKEENLHDFEKLKGERIDISLRGDPHISMERKGCNPELMDYAKHRSGQKSVSSVDDDMRVSSGKENSASGSKRKPKGIQSRGAEIISEVRNSNTKTDAVSEPNSRKSAIPKTHMSTIKVNDSRQDVGKAKERYKDFFGDLEELEDDDIADDMPSIDKSSNCQAVEKGNGESNSVSEDQSSGKKIDQLSRSEAYTRASLSLVPRIGNRLIPDVAAPLAHLVKEDWVCCDKCQTWRLLPPGKNPQSLPKIWLCSMLNWL